MAQTTVSQNNKRIVKNTIMLYIRMLVIMLISLYTVRVTLQILGAEDYGIYNAVAGVMGFIGFISATLTSSAQRYLAYDLGRDDYEGYSKTFSMLMTVFLALALVIVLIAEMLGPWLIGSYLVIPQERLEAAQWIFQISVVTLVVRFITIPYSASIVAHERMDFYAYLSIIEVLLKLAIVYALTLASFDKLIIYAFLLFLMDLLVSLINIVVCYKKIPQCTFRWYWSKSRFKEIGDFIGWNAFGALSGSLQTQAVTLVTSMFFAPTVLASRAIADRVNGVTYSFVTNFVLAGSPQLVKYYAAGDKDNFKTLLYRLSRISYSLMVIIAVPIIVIMPDLLSLWLSDTLLDDMVLFSQLALINAIVSSLETPITRAIYATGYVRNYQIVSCLVAFVCIPLIFGCYKMGMSAAWGYIICTIVLFFSLIYRVIILQHYSSVTVKEYSSNVIVPSALVSFILVIIGFLLMRINLPSIWSRVLLIGSLSLILSIIVIYSTMKKSERKYIRNIIRTRLHANRK